MKNERPWFKAYTHLVLDDPRIGHLGADHALTYFQLYALCARDGTGDTLAGSTRDFAWRLHRSTEFMAAALAVLESAELVAVTPSGVVILDWQNQQPVISEAQRRRQERAAKIDPESMT